MAHDVFISHSSKDKDIASRICDIFEDNEISCWIAPRDVTPGKDYDMEIIDGIENAKVFLLLLSSNSNFSKHVKRELEIAASNELFIFPIRIANVEPSKLLKYFIAGKQWSDIWKPDFTRKTKNAVNVIQDLIYSKKCNEDKHRRKHTNLELEEFETDSNRNIKQTDLKKTIHQVKRENINYKSDSDKNIKKSSSSINKSVLELLDKMDLRVGRRSSGFMMPSRDYCEYGNSEFIFRKLRKLGSKEEVSLTLANIVSSKIEDEKNKWKSIVMLRYLKDCKNVDCIDTIIDSVNENNKKVSGYMHEECVKYMDAINTLHNRNIVVKKYINIINYCLTNSARNAAVKSFSESGQKNDAFFIEFLIDLIETEPDNLIRNTAIRGLKQYDLSYYIEKLFDWIEDTDKGVRNNAIHLSLNYAEHFNASDITDLLEYEKDSSCRINLVRLLHRINIKECDGYFCNKLELGNENVMMQILKDSFYLPKLELFLEQLKNLRSLNQNSDELLKKIDSYIIKYDK